jgi:hypothetical protein
MFWIFKDGRVMHVTVSYQYNKDNMESDRIKTISLRTVQLYYKPENHSNEMFVAQQFINI